MKFVCNTEGKLDEVVAELLRVVGDRQRVVVGLYGDLGSGKTTFTKHLAKKLGISDVITSPTFVIQKRFNINYKNYTNLYHFDMYRIGNESELQPLDWADIISTEGNMVVIEWPEIVESALPKDILKLKFTTVDENTREIEMVE